MQWLRTLGSILWDFQNLSGKFPLEVKSVKLEGLGGEQSIVESAGRFLKELKRETKGLELQMMEGNTKKE